MAHSNGAANWTRTGWKVVIIEYINADVNITHEQEDILAIGVEYLIGGICGMGWFPIVSK